MILTGLITFTILWVLSSTILYFQLVRKIEEVEHIRQEVEQKRRDTLKKNELAYQNYELAIKKLNQIQRSLNCLN